MDELKGITEGGKRGETTERALLGVRATPMLGTFVDVVLPSHSVLVASSLTRLSASDFRMSIIASHETRKRPGL